MYRLLVVDDEEFITDSLAVVLGRGRRLSWTYAKPIGAAKRWNG